MGLLTIIQRAISERNKPPEPARKSSLSETRRVCFSIKVYAAAAESAGDGIDTEVAELEAGKSYEVVIICEQNSRSTNREDIPVAEDFALHIQGVFSNIVPHSTLHHTFAVGYADIEKPRHELTWSLTLPQDLPAGNLVFSLAFIQQSFHSRNNVATLTLPVRGSMYQENLQLLDACNIATGLPEYMAVLAIASENVAASSDGVEIKTTNCYVNNRTISLQVALVAGIAQRFPNDVPAAEILERLKYFSIDQAGELAAWLRDFRAACKQRQQRPCIIIVDTTHGLEIPWELLEIDVFEYLGAVAQVVRWYPFKAYGKSKMLVVKEMLHEGSALAYLDQDLEFTRRERDALRQSVKEDLPHLRSLRIRLRQRNSLARVSLVYIACHGVNGNRLSARLLQRPNNQLRSLETAHMPEHAEPRPVFFLNSCDSARILRDSRTDPSSFATSFLVQCASNYIGTMAPVGTEKASEIGESIIGQAKSAEGVQIAEALRVIRAQVVKKFCQADQENDAPRELQEELFYTFMYVYYGNPLARLRLLTVESEKEGA